MIFVSARVNEIQVLQVRDQAFADAEIIEVYCMRRPFVIVSEGRARVSDVVFSTAYVDEVVIVLIPWSFKKVHMIDGIQWVVPKNIFYVREQ